MITSKYLCEYALGQVGRPYWTGTVGHRACEDLFNQKKKQYPDDDNYKGKTWEKDYKQDEGEKVHDCCGLIKGACWCSGVNKYFTGGNEYESNGCLDWSVESMFANCTEVGLCGNMPEVPGLLVFTATKGHVGVYVGGGKVVEARGRKYGVQLNNMSERSFTHWGKLRCIDYTDQCEVKLSKLAKGSKGNEVKTLQILLNASGVRDDNKRLLDIDGSFGEKTNQSVCNFQKAKGLEVDGKVWTLTWSALLKGV